MGKAINKIKSIKTAARARKSDPETSKLAAASVVESAASQCDRLLQVYSMHKGGLTDADAALVAGFPTGSWKRSADLRNSGAIKWLTDVDGHQVKVTGPAGRAVGISVLVA